ncbi:MAG TPA: carbonic anhydrase [Vicinamibacterales bacterium]|nr:carbonic anhydrase [Vicinamibacterales bacterium]
MTSALEALRRLREGNQRFASNAAAFDARIDPTRRQVLTTGQRPFAIILGCSDSRVPAELVFDQGLGDLFVIRVAGNIVAPSQVGSVEFAADQFGTRLVVVMGHSQCGAVIATVRELTEAGGQRSPNISAIVDRIRPSVESLQSASPELDTDTLVARAVRANVRTSVDHLRHASPLLEELIATRRLLVVGAEYSLGTGLVDFFYGAPESA